MDRPASPLGDPFILRRVAGALIALGAIATSAALGTAGSGGVSSRTAHEPAPPAAAPAAGSLTTARNPACTVARRFSSLDRGVGPFCLPPDAIRAIDDPSFLPAADVHFLDPGEPVVAVRVGERSKAYPVRVLVRHEIVNDRLGDVPVAVTFCPLCNSPVVFDRRVGGRTLTFAVSGRLIRANLVMFDRETETLWQQLTGEPLRGDLADQRLRILPAQMISFEEFRRSAPSAGVMSLDTGTETAYGEDPYAGYGVDPDEPSSFQFGSPTDPRLPPKARVLGVTTGTEGVAVVFPAVPGDRLVVPITIGGEGAVALLAHGTRQTATGAVFATDAEGWAGAAYLPRVGTRPVALEPAPAGFVDTTTGSVFDLTGRAISGSLAGRSLEPLNSSDSFWFAWSYFYPETSVVEP